jgi:hypothetical protein
VIDGLSNDEEAVVSQGRLLKPYDRVYDLVDRIEAQDTSAVVSEIRKPRPEIIYDLVDVIERKPRMALVDTGLHDEIMKRAVEIAERIAREVVPEIAERIVRDVAPDIAERIIREEIEKLKKAS